LGYSYYWSKQKAFNVIKIDIEKFLIDKKIVVYENNNNFLGHINRAMPMTVTIDIADSSKWEFFSICYQLSNDTMQASIDI
jgi:hypothetical protein